LCSAQCTICCMNAMAAQTAGSPAPLLAASPPQEPGAPGAKATARQGGMQPKSPQRRTGGGAPMLNQRLRMQIRERIKGSEPVKRLAGSMHQSQMLHKELEQMTAGFRRTYSAPSPIPDEQGLQRQDAQPQNELEEGASEGQPKEDQTDEHDDAAESREASEPGPPEPENNEPTPEPEKPAPALPVPPRFMSAQERREQAAAELKEEMARIRARAFRRAASLPTADADTDA